MEPGNETDARLLSVKDLWEALLLLLFALPAFLASERTWMGVARATARVRVLVGRQAFARQAMEIAPAFSRLAPASAPDDALVELLAHSCFRYFVSLREHAPWGWNPEISLVGLEGLLEAESEGRGVILYVHPSVHYAIVAKKAVAQAGIRASHLSRVSHGFSSTRFGVRFLNPVLTSIENRYIERRLLLKPGDEVGALRRLVEALRARKVVMVTANAEGRTHELGFLGGTMRLARGAVALAVSRGAPILPLFTARAGHGRYVVEIGSRLRFEVSERGDKAERALLGAYLARLEGFMARYPSQCREWLNRNRWQPQARRDPAPAAGKD